MEDEREDSRPQLRVSQSEADQRIGQQLIRGRSLEQTRIRSYAALQDARAVFDRWCEDTETLLHELFVGPAAVQQYRQTASSFQMAFWFDRSTGLEKARRQLHNSIDAHLKALGCRLTLVPLLTEPAVPPPPEGSTTHSAAKTAPIDGREARTVMNPIEATAHRLLALIVESQEPHVEPAWLEQQTSLNPQDIRDAVELLDELGAVKVGKTLAPPYYLGSIFIQPRGRYLYHEWQAEKEKDEMAKKPAASRSPSRLRVTRDEASRQIRPQIRKGRQLLEAEITNASQLEQAQASFLDWRCYNLEMLTQLFEGGAIVEEFEQAATFRGPVFMFTDHDPFPDSVQRHRGLTRGGVNTLEAILNRLKTIPEPDQSGQSQASFVKGNSMDDRHEPHITRLRVSRIEAEQKIRQSIEQGRKIRSLPMTTQEEAVSAHRELQKWHRVNGDLLRYLSNTADLAHGLGRVPLNNAATGNRFSGMPAARRHLANVDEELNYLESVLEGLPTYKEPGQWQQEQSGPSVTESATNKQPCVFIGHGRSKLWARLVVEITNRWKLKPVYYEFESRTSQSIVPILEKMLDQATFAVLVLTAEDETAEKGMRARQNVVHEVGLFQGRLGFEKVVLLLQSGVEEFSNLAGLQVVPFEGDRIQDTFYELQEAMKREEVLT